MSHVCAPGSPKALPPTDPVVSRALEAQGREGSVSKPTVRINIVDGRHPSAEQPVPRILCGPPSLLFSHCILGAHALLFSVTFIIKGLGETGLAPVFPD